jgi:hypothetical protein
MQKIKCFSITLSVFIFFLVVTNNAHAQPDTIRMNGQVYARLMTAIPDLGASDPYAPVLPEKRLSESNIHIRAVRDFKKKYSNAVDETWLAASRGFTVRFVEDAVLTTVRYKSNGDWIHTVKRYHEPKLAKDIRATVKPVYYDYSILVIYELVDPYTKEPEYYLHMKQHQLYKVVKVANGEMEEVQSFLLQKK